MAKLDVPEPIAAYFAADAQDGDAVARCFTSDASVKDEGDVYSGSAAISRWKTEASRKSQDSCEPLSLEKSNGATIVSCHLGGNSPGGQANLKFRFQLERGKIARLEITPVKE